MDWFHSAERKALKEENERLKRELQEVDAKEEKDITEQILAEARNAADEYKKKSEEVYSRIIMSGDIVTVILKDGTALSKAGVSADVVGSIKACGSEQEIIDLLYPPKPVFEQEKEESTLVADDLEVLRDHEDFIIDGGKVFLKGVSLQLPEIVLASMIELVEKHEIWFQKDPDELEKAEEQYQALKMFWYWTALNPIESSRNDLLSFVQKKDVKITSNGLLEMYRRIVKVGDANKALVDFVSEQYFRIKKMKKGTANYEVLQEIDSKQLLLVKLDTIPDVDGTWEPLGILQELYLNLPNMEENIYTDAYTNKMKIKIGEVYKIDESDVDLNSNRDCSSGLHVGSHDFLFDGNGDTGVLALVNPMKVRSVPYSDARKMRVSEMFIAAVVPLKDYRDHVLSEDINDYSENYFNSSLEELEKALESKSFEPLVCQDNVPAVTIKEVIDIKNLLKSRIQQIV